MTRCSTRRALLGGGVALGLLVACASPAPAPRGRLVEPRERAAAPLPEDLEIAAGRVAALVLADRPDSALSVLERMRREEEQRHKRGEPRTGLVDDTSDLVAASFERTAYLDHAEEMLEDGEPDDELRARLERELEEEPLAVAERRLSEDRWIKYGGFANRLMKPASKLLMAGVPDPVETSSAALSTLLIVRGFPEATIQERQALRAYQEFVERYPDDPEAPYALEQIERYQEELLEQEHDEALEIAQRACDARQPRVCLAHLERAERLVANDPDALELRQDAEGMLEQREASIDRALSASSLNGAPLSPEQDDDFERVAASLLALPLSEMDLVLDDWPEGVPELDDERAYVESLRSRGSGREDEFFERMEHLTKGPDQHSNMARHAYVAYYDPAQDPYRALEIARRHDRNQRVKWVMFGTRANGAARRNLWRPLEWVLDAPAIAVTTLTFPLRVVQYPAARPRFGGPVIKAGEGYLARFPEGAHAEEVNIELEDLYATRSQWSQALEHHQRQAEPDPETIASYRDRIAERTLMAARSARRIDARAAIYRSVVLEYPETEHAEVAREEVGELLREYTPQRIRLSREFLEENPALVGPGALSLKPELFDGEEENGELADEGVLLIGSTLIRILLEDAEPVTERVDEEDFARFVSLLEETTHRSLREDSREVPIPDPQRDVFFERARLGLLDETDMRPAASSDAEFLGTREKYGMVRRRESPLPVEVVLQGGLEDFGFAAFPRIKLPGQTPDAFLYR